MVEYTTNLVRRYKLSKLTGINYLSDTEIEMVNFVNSKILNLSDFTMKEYTDSIFYMNDMAENIFRYNSKHGSLYIKHKDFWKDFKYKYTLKYSDIQYIIEYMMKSIYKLNIKKSGFTDSYQETEKVEYAYVMYCCK